MHKAHRFRLYPNPEQAIRINKTIGCTRFIFNHFLAKRKDAYEQEKKTLHYNDCFVLLTDAEKGTRVAERSALHCPTVGLKGLGLRL